jgi:hypothetical protein
MLLVDPADLSVHEIAPDAVTSSAGLACPTPFERFETTARSAFCSIFLAARFPECRVATETLSFVQLANGRGWVWASRIRVLLAGELPIEARTMGEEFLFLWPVPMAINAFLNFKEKARQREGLMLAPLAFYEAVKAHPPSMAFVPNKSLTHGYDIAVTREVRAKDMTVAQRLFVGSLSPHTTPFAARAPCDKWSDSLCFRDKCHLDSFLHCGARPGRGRSTRARQRACPQPARRGSRTASLDLPDDLVGRIACMHIAAHMASADGTCAAVAQLRGVCKQFRATTDAAMGRMLGGVVATAHSLLGDDPCEPGHAQSVVSSAGITLRYALSLPREPNWVAYVVARRQLELRAKRVPQPVFLPPAPSRCALLWDEFAG